MANNIVQLSKLSRGRGENKGSYIEVVYDDEVKCLLFISSASYNYF